MEPGGGTSWQRNGKLAGGTETRHLDNVVYLDIFELDLAYTVGKNRRLESIRRGLKDNLNGERTNRWDDEMNGAAAELAYCKWKGISWEGTVNAPKSQPDIPPDIQIRSTGHAKGSLIIRPPDIRNQKTKNHRYVLVINPFGNPLEFRIAGWIVGVDATINPDWWRDYDRKGHAWWVPQDALNPMETI